MRNHFSLFDTCTGVSTDTRDIGKDQLFIALKGENFNGNKYAQMAIDKGAKYAIVDEIEFADDKQIFYVEESLIFLQKLAEYHRNKFDIPVIGITGSNGKTTTKELIAIVLSEKYNVHYTKGNLNNHIGVPLTLLQLNDTHEIAIIEMGASHVGDIKELTDIAHPSHCIITNIGTAHIEGFGSQENIIKTKTEMYRAVEAVKGHFFYNIDDELLVNQIPKGCSYSTYGTSEKGDISGELTKLSPEINFKWKSKEYTSPILSTHIIGKYNLTNMLAAACIGNHFNVEPESIDKALQSYKPTNNRSQLEKTGKNKLILDAYNANPTSVKVALENFAEIEGKNKLFIIGDMLELGPDTLTYHQEIITLANALNLQGVFVGSIFTELSKEIDILAFPTTEEAKAFFLTAAPKDNLILLKGSRGIGLEKLVDIL